MNKLFSRYRVGRKKAVWFLPLAAFFISDVKADGYCTFSNTSAQVATVSSAEVYNNSYQNQANSGMACSGIAIGILTSETITSTVSSTTNNFRMVNNDGSGDAIPYALFADANRVNQMTAGRTIDYRSTNLLSIVLGSGSGTIPIYIQTAAGANVRAGTYTDVININWTYELCSLGVIICLIPQSGTGNSAVTINLTVNKSCVINSSPDVNLGANSFIGQFNPVTGTINVTCTKTEGYKTYFSNGANYSAPWRRLRSAQGNFLQYHIYVPDTDVVWDANNKQTGVGSGFSSNINYQVRLNAAQPEQLAGSYSDTLTFTIEY